MLANAEANLELAGERLVASDGAGAQIAARLAYTPSGDAVNMLPGDPANPDLKTIRFKLISAYLVITQTADLLLIEPLVPTPADLPTYDRALATARAALGQARDAIAAAASGGLVDCRS